MFLIWLQSNLLYYYHHETGFVIYDFRPFVDFGEGVFLENDIGFSFTDDEVVEQLRNNYEDFMNSPSLLLFCCGCSGKTYYGIIEQPVVRCPLCKGITLMVPWFCCKDHTNFVSISNHYLFLFIYLFIYLGILISISINY